MIDIREIAKKIIEEKDNIVAKAFTAQIGSLLLTNGIVPIMTEYRLDDLETIIDSDRYKLVSELGITIDSLDTSKHDAKVRSDAIDECIQFVRKNRNLFITNAISEHFILGLETLKEQKNAQVL